VGIAKFLYARPDRFSLQHVVDYVLPYSWTSNQLPLSVTFCCRKKAFAASASEAAASIGSCEAIDSSWSSAFVLRSHQLLSNRRVTKCETAFSLTAVLLDLGQLCQGYQIPRAKFADVCPLFIKG
jgi:hypothetical protein